jgi:hypothetical protein
MRALREDAREQGQGHILSPTSHNKPAMRQAHEASYVKVNVEDAAKHVAKWQNILRLRDWDIRTTIVKTTWRKSGDIKIDLEDRKAVFLVNSCSKCENLEELVIHELLHLKLYGLDQMIEELLSAVYGDKAKDAKRELAATQFMKLLESTVEDLTKGYLAAAGSPTPLSFGRLQKQIDDEVGST